MNVEFLDCYIFVSIIIAVADVLLAVVSIHRNQTTGRYLGFACLGAAVVDISYLVSILSRDYLWMSLMSSLYFIHIDIMLICLLVFTVYFTKGKFTGTGKRLLGLSVLYAAFEVVVFAINPFREIAIHYVPRNTAIAMFSYEMKPLYWMHLIFTYTLVLVVVGLLLRKMRQIPREYRTQYGYVILGIVAIVSVNAVFLYWPGEEVYNLLDYSICGYSLTAFLLYWSCFNYSTHGMLNRLKTSIFENIGQGIVLFDYDDHMILHNEKAVQLLGGFQLEQCGGLKDFLRRYNLPEEIGSSDESYSLQCYVRSGDEPRPLRCDIRGLTNDQGHHLGQMFVFSDAALETDLLTGFQSWESFQIFTRDNQNAFHTPTAVAICDINRLSVINSTRGISTGDQRIKALADTMRQCFPKQTYYVRGLEASLIALCSHSNEAEMLACMERVQAQFPGKMQFAVSVAAQEPPDVLQAIQVATKSMRAKKLLDRESIHSEMITSLIRALEECDSDTEHHVKRTQKMGAELGKRIKLTDSQQSSLSLLCLLHDIGKIGIPLEILNKPGKLSEEEWVILQSHTEKGYEIARSSNELKCIAEEIRHHHERWDGNGYPDGLSRESIPLLSRVIAVVDAYDAMTNNRSYKSARSTTYAMEELRRCAGTQFDPFIVSEFLRMLKENPPEVVQPLPEPAVSQIPSVQAIEEPAGVDSLVVHPISYSRYLLDESMRIVLADENFEAVTGYTQEDIRSGELFQSSLIPEEDRTEYLCRTTASLAKSSLVYQEHRLRRKDGSDIYVFCFGKKYYDSAARTERSEIIIANVANTYSVKMMTEEEQTKAQNRLRHWESTYRRDSLTGLLTHAAFRSDVEQGLLLGKRQLMMLMLDVDYFKEYNDTYGHHEGDQLLILIAQALQAAMRDEDRACRMGGDEFAAVLFFDQQPQAKLRERAMQIFDKVSMTLQSARDGTSISMGMAMAKPDMTFNELYEAADRALYRAKDNGRGRLMGEE